MSKPALFHFSDDPAIEVFRPRPVAIPSRRPAGQDWLNGPLVWAVDEWHRGTYIFPRDCPRILMWPLATSSPADADGFRRKTDARMLAYVETAWLDRLTEATLACYVLPNETFEAIGDAGKWVSPSTVTPTEKQLLTDLPDHLAEAGVDLRPIPSLTVLKNAWETTLHVSGIRLRNARDW